MLISKTNRILSLVLSMLIFISSTGFSIDLHYCQGKVKSFSFFGKAPSCHQQNKKKHCKKKEKTCHSTFSKQDQIGKCQKDCCSNRTFKIESNDRPKQLQPVEIFPIQVQFLTSFVQVFLLKKRDLHKIIIPYLNYIPPLLNKNIPVLVQSFLL